MPDTCVGYSLTHKYQTQLERPATDKCSSLIGLFISDEEKGLITLGPRISSPLGLHCPVGTNLQLTYDRQEWICGKEDSKIKNDEFSFSMSVVDITETAEKW